MFQVSGKCDSYESEGGTFNGESGGGGDLQVVRGVAKEGIFGLGDVCGEARQGFEIVKYV